MGSGFLLYGATGFVGEAIARLALEQGLRPVLAGRDAARIAALAAELGLEQRVFGLDDLQAMDRALGEAAVVLHCAGPYIYTSRAMADGCLRTGAHYLDLTGEIPVFEALSTRDGEARTRQVMLLPAVGFDVTPTDCLALHLKQRLPSATHLALAFQSHGPAGLPPGTASTIVEMIPYGARIRRNGLLEPFRSGMKTRLVDFGRGPVEASLFPWGDVFTAFYSTGIPNIEDYTVLPAERRREIAFAFKLRPLFRLAMVRRFVRARMKTGSTAEQLAASSCDVWGEVTDDQGRKAVARLHGPESGVVWTARSALAAVRQVLAGNALPGFQTPASAFGADFVLEAEGVIREDLD
jgi:short subunit dehydrogenase-like uncharacterized protein